MMYRNYIATLTLAMHLGLFAISVRSVCDCVVRFVGRPQTGTESFRARPLLHTRACVFVLGECVSLCVCC